MHASWLLSCMAGGGLFATPRRGTDVPFADSLLCPDFSAGVACRYKTGETHVAYDYIIVGGGSAGSVMANRRSAKTANKVLVCEAGQDTPPGAEPPEIRDSYSGTAYFDPRFHWTELKVTTEVVSHNNPQENPPPLRKYEQARVVGGGSAINGQLANRGAPSDYDEWEARGLGVEGRPAVFEEVRARPRLRRAVARQGWPHPGAAHPASALDGART